MRKKNPWTLLRNRLKPLILELHAATPWRIAAPETMEEWVKRQTWHELWWGDEVCQSLCSEPPKLPRFPVCLTVADMAADPAGDEWQSQMARQAMHRMIYAVDLSRSLSPVWRREFVLTGDFSADARKVLIDGWRSNAVLEWARMMGRNYVG